MIATADAFRTLAASSVPSLTAAQMAEVDRLAIEEFGIDLLQLMEQAGSHLAELVRVEAGGDLRGTRVLVLAGSGNNGGGGLAAARHLANRGAQPRVVLARPASRLGAAARHHLGTLLEMAVDCCVAIHDVPASELDAELQAADVVVDALLGYRSDGPPRDGVRWLTDRLHAVGGPVVSLDLPSGLDADTGAAPAGTVRADATLTLALPKHGLFRGDGPRHAGRVHLADLGIPSAVYRRLGIDDGAPFAAGRIVRLTGPA